MLQQVGTPLTNEHPLFQERCEEFVKSVGVVLLCGYAEEENAYGVTWTNYGDSHVCTNPCIHKIQGVLFTSGVVITLYFVIDASTIASTVTGLHTLAGEILPILHRLDACECTVGGIHEAVFKLKFSMSYEGAEAALAEIFATLD